MEKIVGYFQESYEEFVRKTTWPTFTELQKNAVLVVVSSIIFALAVSAMDTAITKVLEFIYDVI